MAKLPIEETLERIKSIFDDIYISVSTIRTNSVHEIEGEDNIDISLIEHKYIINFKINLDHFNINNSTLNINNTSLLPINVKYFCDHDFSSYLNKFSNANFSNIFNITSGKFKLSKKTFIVSESNCFYYYTGNKHLAYEDIFYSEISDLSWSPYWGFHIIENKDIYGFTRIVGTSSDRSLDDIFNLTSSSSNDSSGFHSIPSER